MSFHAICHIFVAWDKDFLMTPVEFLLVIAGEWVDHRDNRGLRSTTDMIEIEHTLNGLERTGIPLVFFLRDRLLLSAFPTQSLELYSKITADRTWICFLHFALHLFPVNSNHSPAYSHLSEME